MRRRPLAAALAITLAMGAGLQAAGETPAAEPLESEGPAWEFSASVYGYFVPEDSDYLQPSATVDYGDLHFEARYNYEDLETGSVWVGYNFSFGESLALELTPMVGGVFGNTAGVAPGCRVSLDWRWLGVYSEAEHLIGTSDHADSFFYAWSEVTLSPLDWLWFGLVGQRTRAYESSREIQRGLLVGFGIQNVELVFHAFNPDDSDPLYVLSAGVSF